MSSVFFSLSLFFVICNSVTSTSSTIYFFFIDRWFEWCFSPWPFVPNGRLFTCWSSFTLIKEEKIFFLLFLIHSLYFFFFFTVFLLFIFYYYMYFHLFFFLNGWQVVWDATLQFYYIHWQVPSSSSYFILFYLLYLLLQNILTILLLYIEGKVRKEGMFK